MNAKIKKIFVIRTILAVRRIALSMLACWQQDIRLLKNWVYDAGRYRRYYYRKGRMKVSPEHLQAMMIMEAHAVEKGFCLPEPRMGYGASRIRRLIVFMRQHREAGFDCSHFAYRNAQSVLSEYVEYHDQQRYDLGTLLDEIKPWAEPAGGIGGYKELTKDEIIKQAQGNFETCAMSRHSIRNFSSESVPEETICDAVRIAQKSPSVCNRQSWRVYIAKDPEYKQKVLILQNGNKGFGHTADFVALITTDIRAFTGAHERNQPYIDGGLFAMSFMYALHSKGVGTCPLNWMVGPHIDRKLRKIVPIKPSENVIMMMVGGFMTERMKVPKSARSIQGDTLTAI